MYPYAFAKKIGNETGNYASVNFSLFAKDSSSDTNYLVKANEDDTEKSKEYIFNR